MKRKYTDKARAVKWEVSGFYEFLPAMAASSSEVGSF